MNETCKEAIKRNMKSLKSSRDLEELDFHQGAFLGYIAALSDAEILDIDSWSKLATELSKEYSEIRDYLIRNR